MTHLSRPNVSVTRMRTDGSYVLSISAAGRRLLIDPAHLPVLAEDINVAVRHITAEQDKENQ